MTDAELIGGMATGEMTSLDALFARHGARVHAFLARRCDPATADDLTQETFLRALAGAGLFAGRGSAVGWLLKIARHLLLDRWRREGRTPPTGSELATDDPARDAADAERDGRLRAAVDRLPEPLRELLLLRVVDELSYAEITEVTGVPERTARHRLRRATDALRAELKETDHD